MSRLETLKENLTRLAHTNPSLARDLIKSDKNDLVKDFEFCNTDKKELNLLHKKKFNPYTLHKQSGAVHECSEWLAELKPNCQVLYVFGAGLGYSFFTFRKWLKMKPKLHLVYVEPNLSVIFHLFQTDLGRRILNHPRVHFFNFKSKGSLKQLIQHLSAEFSQYKAKVITSPIYCKRYPRITACIQSELPKAHDSVSTLLKEGQHAKNSSFRNFTGLAPNLDGFYNGSMCVDLLKGVPCIIVGAGPSLQKNIDVLKTLSNHALILAGSSAISGLTSQGIIPHMGNYFDPYRRVYDRFMTNSAFELPTISCARTFLEVSRRIHGPQIYLKGSTATPVVNWIEESLGFHGVQNEELISVTSSNTFFAQLLGCSPIIYVGVDLAYTNNQSYMKGITKEALKDEEDLDESSSEFAFNEDMESIDIDGNPIKTRYGWTI